MTSSYLDSLLIADVLVQPPTKSAIGKLNLPSASNGLDAGCGVGLQCTLLAEQIGPEGHVTGLDISSEFLAYGEHMVKARGLEDRISFANASVADIPYADDTFDWVWSANCVGYGPWEPMPLLRELKRVTKPGGLVVILAWSCEQLLPGYPLLEAKLRATTAGLSPFTKDMQPSRHFPRALGWFRELGLVETWADVCCQSVHAPLSDEVYKAMTALFEMRWPGVEGELSDDDLDLYERLCMPESADFILKHQDYYAFFCYSMFVGTV